MELELRDWIKRLASRDEEPASSDVDEMSADAADYLERIATDGAFKGVFAELAEHEPDLAG